MPYSGVPVLNNPTTTSPVSALDTPFPVTGQDGVSLSVALTGFYMSDPDDPGYEDAQLTFRMTNTGTTIVTNFCPYAVFAVDQLEEQIQLRGTESGGQWCISNLLPGSYVDVTDGNPVSGSDTFSQVILVPTSSTLAPFPTWNVAMPGASSTSTTGTLPEVESCSDTAGAVEIRPSDIGFGCADLNTDISSIDWTSWTATSAGGTGTFSEDNCVPDCADGSDSTEQATISLSDPGEYLGALVFQNVTVSPVGGGAPLEAEMGEVGSSWGSG